MSKLENTLALTALSLVFFACEPATEAQDQETKTPEVVEVDLTPAQALIAEVNENTGTYEELKALKDVSYTYIYESGERKRVFHERYIFDGELSWGRQLPEEQVPVAQDTLTQFYDGVRTLVYLNSDSTNDEKLHRRADFTRKTNFYWFSMMQKLQDPSVTHKLLAPRMVDSIEYQIVQMNFEEHVGDVQDRYVLYVNPKTKLIDQFLFTVGGDGEEKKPNMMRIHEYKSVDGIMLMAKRAYYRTDWDGNTDGISRGSQTLEAVKYNNGFERGTF